MPLVRFDLMVGRTDEELRTLLDAAHRAVVSAFGVPERDRYQIVHEHSVLRMIIEDTGLGFTRTNAVVVITIVSRPRTERAKLRLYEELCRELDAICGIAPSDVVISLQTNTDADWSFGMGRAQFITGEL